MNKYLTIEVSSESRKQADKILNTLLDKKLVTGGQFIDAPARFRWKGEIVDMDYVTITSFTTQAHKAEIIELAERASEEEVPMIRFIPFEGNPKLEKWIDETVK